jgi:diguanylate cyclase (GGDEF)-like protein
LRRPAAGRALAFSLTLLGLAAPVAALDPRLAVTQYRRDVWKTREGLPQGSVEAIAQTADGYLWLGTQEGLARFDGVRFVAFDKSNTPALRHNRVTALLADRQGHLWIGTEGGGATLLRDGRFASMGTEEGLPNPRVRSFVEDGAGSIWVGTDGGLARFQGGRFVAGPRGEDLARRPITALHAGRDGLWIGVRDGIVRVRGGAVERTATELGPTPVTAVWEDEDGTLWLGTSQGLFVRRPGKTEALREPARLPNADVSAIFRDRDGGLWVGTDGGAARIAAAPGAGRGAEVLSNHRVLQFFEDREGSLWIGMQDGGATRLAAGKFTTYSAAEGLADDIVWPIFGDREGNVWIGTKDGGLSRLRDGVFETFSTRQGLSSNAVQAIAQAPDGALWIGTRGGGLNRLDRGRVTVYRAPRDLPHDSISALLTARDGSLWIGTRGGGLCRFRDGSCTTRVARDRLPNDTVHSLLEARDGSLWIGTNGGGLVRLRDGELRAYTARDGLSSDIVNVVHEDAQGTLWVGTYGGGLNRMRGERFTAYTTSQGLHDDAIFSILEDSRGRLWMSCNKGVFRVDKQELDAFDRGDVARLHPVAYGSEDGMKDRECNGANFPPAWKGGDGRLWFPTIEGATSIDAERMRTNAVPPPVNVEQVVVDGTVVAARDGLVLGSGARNVELHYSAPSFVVPERVRYRYRLEGLDPEWVDAGARRVAYYSRLPPGSFRFEVAAANDDGLWNEEGAALSFRLPPRFYQTPWFSVAAALALAAVLWGADRLRTRRRVMREAALERLVEERTRELAEANLRLERLSALDPLTGVANRRRFDAALEVEWRRASRTGEPLSLILADLDFFKPFNDTNGHLAGDESLRQVARYLSRTLGRAGDLVARYGGEEFVALLPAMTAGDAAALAERLRAGVEALALPHNASAVSRVVTLSAGVATTVPSDEGSAETLLAAADAALYRAKGEGRNRVALAMVK